MFETGTASDHADLLERLHTFLTTNGSAFGLAYVGTGNGTLTGYKGGSASVAETFTLTATSSTTFTVVGAVSGALSNATVGTPYTGTKVQFALTAGGTALVAGDVFTLSTAPKWTSMQRARGCYVTASAGTSGALAGENVIDGKKIGDGSRHWAPGTITCTLQLDFLEAETIAEYAILTTWVGTGSTQPKSWTFEYWTGSAWSVLDTRTNWVSWTNDPVAFTVSSPVSATRYRLNFSAGYSTTITVSAIEMRRAAGGINVAFSQYMWKAPGNNGTSEIYLGAHHLRRTAEDYFDWEIFAFDGYTAGLNLYQQPGCHSSLWLPLWQNSIPYWFVADGRRCMVVAKIQSQYEVAYLGFYDSFFTPSQYPYPICLGGPVAPVSGGNPGWNDSHLRWATVDSRHRAFTHAEVNGGYVNDSQLHVRGMDGVWVPFVSASGDTLWWTPTTQNLIWPYAGDFNLLDVCHDGSYALWPVMLLGLANPTGQLSGVFAVTGQSITAESLVRLGAVDHLVVLNVNRSDRNDYLAVRLD